MSEVFSKENLLIIGAGQYGQVAREIAESMNCFDKISFLDDNNPKAVGKMADYEKFVMDYEYAIVAIGNSALRLEFTEKLRKESEILYRTAYKSRFLSTFASE